MPKEKRWPTSRKEQVPPKKYSKGYTTIFPVTTVVPDNAVVSASKVRSIAGAHQPYSYFPSTTFQHV